MEIFKKAKAVATTAGKNVSSFLNNRFEFSVTKRSKIIGIIIGFIALELVVFRAENYITQEFAAKWLLLILSLLAAVLIAFFTIVNIKIKNELANQIWHLAFLFILPLITLTMTECLNNVFIYNMTYYGFLCNYLIIFLMYAGLFGITGSFRISYIVITTILYGFSLAHCFIMQFRGTPFLPWDFLSVTTAAGVANTYNFMPDYKMIIATLIFIFILVIAAKTKTPKFNLITKIISRASLLSSVLVLVILFYSTDIFVALGAKPDFWNQTRGYKNSGFVWSFICNTRYLKVSKPSNYDSEKIDEYLNDVVGDSEDTPPVVDNSYQKPNIICIMNESLSDLSVLGNLETNIDYMPFMRSLTENTVKGNLYVPVIGAGTSNTEFEFLTGHSTAFLPSGSNAYMLYVKNPFASLVSTMEAQGYSSYALHPYYASGWKRTQVYNYFGFNKFISLENIMDISLMKQYQDNGNDPDVLQQLVNEKYPDRKNMLIRHYISDSYNYKLLIEDFENRDKSIPYFAFNVTMQNHGGYATSALNFNENVYVTSASKQYNKANKYLSLVKASDDAFKELIEYFKNVEEPTVICMFGDHQPSIEAEFIAEVLGVNNLSGLSQEQEQMRHVTPFFIWANYDIEEQYIDKLSANYLSSLLLKTAGVKLTEYNKFLLKLSETLPVIDTVGYIDNKGSFYEWSVASPYTGVLENYKNIQYNGIFDYEKFKKEVFCINGYLPEVVELEE